MLDERRFTHEESREVALDTWYYANAVSAQAAMYLCGECAERMGAKWPHGHRATFHPATCPFCQSCRPIACWDDWNWPKAPGLNKIAKSRREV